MVITTLITIDTIVTTTGGEGIETGITGRGIGTLEITMVNTLAIKNYDEYSLVRSSRLRGPFCLFYFMISAIDFPISAGLCTTCIPHSLIIFIFAAAVSSAPPMIAPA